MWKIAKAERVPSLEGSTRVVAMQDDIASPGSKAVSRMNSIRWNMRGPTGSARLVSGGGWRRGRCRSRHPSWDRESDWLIVLMTPPKETRRAEGRGQPGRSPREGGVVRTQSRVTMPSNLARVNAAARRGRPDPLHGPAASCQRRGARTSVPAPEAAGKRGRRRDHGGGLRTETGG